MPLAAGTATSGKTGALALQSQAPGGVLRYSSVAGFSPRILRGDALIPLINNAAFAANKTKGLTMADFTYNLPLIPGMTPADFFARAVGSVSGDTDESNYHLLTMYPDNAGSAPDVYARCKFGTFAGQVAFSVNGAAQAVALTMGGMSVDPQSGAVAALAPPPVGAISNGGVSGFAQTAVTGASQVVGVSWNVSTGLVPTPGVLPGTNSAYPYLVKGLLQNDITGIVSVTQYKNAAAVLGADGSDGTLDLAFGPVGNGLGMTFALMPVAVALPSTQNINFITSRYALKSIDALTSPILFRNL